MMISQNCSSLQVSESDYVGLLQMRVGGVCFYWSNSSENQREAEISIKAFAEIVGAVVLVSPCLPGPDFFDRLRRERIAASLTQSGTSVPHEALI